MKTNHFVSLWIEGRKSSEYGAPLISRGQTTLHGFVDYELAREKAIKVGRNIIKQNSHYHAVITNEDEGQIVIEFCHSANERPQKRYTIQYA